LDLGAPGASRVARCGQGGTAVRAASSRVGGGRQSLALDAGRLGQEIPAALTSR